MNEMWFCHVSVMLSLFWCLCRSVWVMRFFVSVVFWSCFRGVSHEQDAPHVAGSCTIRVIAWVNHSYCTLFLGIWVCGAKACEVHEFANTQVGKQ